MGQVPSPSPSCAYTSLSVFPSPPRTANYEALCAPSRLNSNRGTVWFIWVPAQGWRQKALSLIDKQAMNRKGLRDDRAVAGCRGVRGCATVCGKLRCLCVTQLEVRAGESSRVAVVDV